MISDRSAGAVRALHSVVPVVGVGGAVGGTRRDVDMRMRGNPCAGDPPIADVVARLPHVPRIGSRPIVGPVSRIRNGSNDSRSEREPRSSLAGG